MEVGVSNKTGEPRSLKRWKSLCRRFVDDNLTSLIIIVTG